MHHYFKAKRLLIIVTGSIALFKTLDLISYLRKYGAEVRVVMTTAAQEFITPLTFEAMSQNKVYSDLFAESTLHIELAKWPDAILIVPATANTLAKAAHGIAEDLIDNLLLATNKPIAFAPAMNQAMWHHPATQENIKRLHPWDWRMIPPQAGHQACGDEGMGNMATVEDILLTLPVLWQKKLLHGKKVLVTTGGTQEAIDPVRFLTNRSSGKMGYALAKACYYAGAEVRLITTIERALPKGNIHTVKVTSTEEMRQACIDHMEDVDMVFGAAAPCDFRIKEYSSQKIKKSDELKLSFSKNTDILTNLKKHYPRCCIIGFAAETENLLDNAKTKRSLKNLDFVMANPVSEHGGFDQDYNEGILISAYKTVPLQKQTKDALAWNLLELVTG